MKVTDSKHFYSYLAGVIDSDGSISVLKRHQKRTTPTFTVTLQLTWKKTKNSEFFLKFLKAKYGGTIFVQKYRVTSYGKISTTLKYSCTARKVEVLLKDIEPYIFLKTKQIKLALELLKTTKFGVYGNGRPKPKRLFKKHENICNKVRLLNNKNSGFGRSKIDKKEYKNAINKN